MRATDLTPQFGDILASFANNGSCDLEKHIYSTVLLVSCFIHDIGG